MIATHGRGFWVLDDLTPLYQINDSMANAKQWLYQPRVAIRMDGKQLTEEKAEKFICRKEPMPQRRDCKLLFQATAKR